MEKQKISYIYALGAVLLWSTVATAFKIALSELKPMELLLYSSFGALLLLFGLILYQKRMGIVISHLKKHPFLILLLGFINPFIYYFTLFKAYSLLPAQEAQAINYTWALMLSYLSVIFLKHRLGFYDIVAGLVAYFGVLIISTKGDIASLHFSNTLGVSFALLSTLLWSIYWIFSTKIKADPVVVLFCNFFVGFAFVLLYMILFDTFKMPNLKGVLTSLYISFFEMGVTFILWLKALRYSTNTSKTANLIFLSPILSLFFIHYFVGEKIQDSTIIALVFILFGLSLQKIKSK